MAIIKVGDKATAPSVRPSLLLDFANSKTLDPRITFGRSSVGTYYDGKTTVKAEENLVPTSRYIGGSGWNITAYNVYQDYATAPDGTTTATKASPTSAGAGTSVAIGTGVSKTTDAYTWSIYAKIDSADYPAIALYWNSSGSANVRFDIQNGTVAATANGNGTITGLIEDAGNGWYRCISTYSGATSTEATLYVLDSATNGDWTLNNSPDGVKGILVWGAQIEERSSVTTYTPTTTKPIVRYQPVLQTAPSNTPRFDHNPVTKESKGLLIEQARTNLQPSSQTMQNWTYSLNVSYVSNYGIAPDGTQTADLVIPNTTNAQHYFGIPQAISPGTGTEAFSFFVKPVGTATTYNLYFRTANMNGNQSQIFDFQTGQLGTSGSSNVSQTMTSVGNGWYRCSIAYNSTKANPYPTLYFADSTNANSTTLATDGYSGFLIWGGQLEVGLHVTSYIPTSGSTITRSSDICYSVDSAFTPDGTFTAYTEASLDYDNTVANINATIFSFGPDRIQVRYDDQTGSELLVFNPSFVASLNASTPTINSGKTAVRIGQNDFKHSFSGSTPNSDAAGIFDVPETMYIGNLSNNSEFLNGHIQKIAIYPAALDDAELEALTEE